MLRRILRAFSPAAFFVLAFVVVLLAGRSDESAADQIDTVDAAAAPVATTPPLATPQLEPTPTPLIVPTATPIPPTATPEPTPLPTATSTPAPTATPAPPTPTAVPTQAPTATPIPEPTAAPTATPIPATATAVPEPASATSDRIIYEVGALPMAQAGPVTLLLPVGRIELIGFHEAGHPGAQALNPLSSGVDMFTMATRSRGTDPRSAADIVVPTGTTIVAPATGTVVSARNYVLYCEHNDALVYIEPDGLPGWQVRVFHVEGITVAPGTRVIAGETAIASSVRLLPFESQIDEFTAEPSWGHVHVEVVDTTVPDTRPPGPGCP